VFIRISTTVCAFHIAALLFFDVSLSAQEQSAPPAEQKSEEKGIIISASKNDTTTGRTGNQVVVITRDDIEKSGAKTVRDALTKVQGLYLAGTGSYGGTVSLFMRGSDSSQVLVLIDGVPANDPMDVGRGFDFARLSVLNIERIEILYGAQSTLYGSNASAGVINIVTSKGDGAPHITASAEYGSNKTFNESFVLNGKTDRTSYSFAARRSDSQGISKAAKDKSSTGSYDNDGYHSTELSSRLFVPVNDKFSFDSTIRFEDSKYDTDDDSFIDDSNKTFSSRFFSAGLTLSWDTFSWWRNIFSYSTSSTTRIDYDKQDPDGSFTDAWFEGISAKGEWRNIFTISDFALITAGTEYNKEKGSQIYYSNWGTTDFSEKSAEIASAYTLFSLSFKDWIIYSSGIRLDNHSDFGNAVTDSESLLIKIPLVHTKLRGSRATSFKAPSLYQLYAPTYGNTNLDPEKGKSYDVGIEQSIADVVELKASWFINHYSDMIGFSTHYENIGKTKTKGLENSLKITPSKLLTFQAQYTYTIARDLSNNTDLIRRPEHKGSFSINFTPIEELSIYYDTVIVGKRSDKYFDPVTYATEDKTLKRYTVSNAHVSYTFLTKYKLFIHCDNIRNVTYTEVYGYKTPGRSFSSGIKAEF